ncbi:MAG: AAA family ATPase [Deltaproteobacteria bacterium]|nr:AAA family ATPase [Deltaproteobacteria bacterium]
MDLDGNAHDMAETRASAVAARLADCEPFDPKADAARDAAKGDQDRAVSQLREWGLKSVETAGWLDNPAPPVRALLTANDAQGYPSAFMPAGVVALLVAPGGTGKTQALMQLAVAVSCGRPWLGTYSVANPGPVCLIVGEEGDEGLHRRIRGAVDAGSAWDLAAQVKVNLFTLSMRGRDACWTDEDGKERAPFTALLAGLKALVERWSLVILDPASRFLGPECEIDNAAATRWIELAERLTIELPGNPTVLVAHHTNKSALAGATDQGAARGSSALTDGARWQANLDRITEVEKHANGKPTGKRLFVPNEVILHVVKANDCPIFPDLHLRRDLKHGGFLVPIPNKPVPESAATTSVRDRAAGVPVANDDYDDL